MATDYPTQSALIFSKQPHVHYDCGQNLFNFLPEKLNLGRLHTYISHFTDIGHQTFFKKVVDFFLKSNRYLASHSVNRDWFIIKILEIDYLKQTEISQNWHKNYLKNENTITNLLKASENLFDSALVYNNYTICQLFEVIHNFSSQFSFALKLSPPFLIWQLNAASKHASKYNHIF